MRKRPKETTRELPDFVTSEEKEIDDIILGKKSRVGVQGVLRSTSMKKEEAPKDSRGLKELINSSRSDDSGRIEDFDATKKNGYIKRSSEIDYQTIICKDFYETGYCTFGEACKFLHVRDNDGTTREGKEASDKADFELGLKANASLATEKPGICDICKQFYRNPVILKCGHIFCEECAIGQLKKDRRCFSCGMDTEGILNTYKAKARP